jgi:hypothetical protein
LKNRVLVLEIQLLALHDGRAGVQEVQNRTEENDYYRGDEVEVDLADVHHCYDD